MLQKLRRATAAVSVLLVTITITLTLTLTVSATATATSTSTVTAIDERTTAANATTITTSATKGDAATAAVISERRHGKETTTAAAETTTTTFLTLQPPPLNVTSPTTSSYEPESKSESKAESTAAASTPKSNDITPVEASSPTKNSISHKIDEANSVAVKSDKKNGDKGLQSNANSEEAEKKALEQQIPKKLITLLSDDSSHSSNSSRFVPPLMMPEGFRSHSERMTTPKGYLSFDAKDPIELIAKQKEQKTQTVNEVLASLFPNGFSDIFRLSYTSEQAISTKNNTSLPKSTTPRVIITTPKATTSNPDMKPSFRYTTSVSKEYRRLVSPGHTEIVVEKLALPSSSEEFNDGSNSISKDDLLRINRAAVDSPVLPSLLVDPAKTNDTVTSAAPIVILKENSSEHDDLNDEVDDDNLIAESQDISQHVFQRLPEANAKQNHKNKLPEVNVEIIHDDTLKQTPKRVFGQRLFTPAAELPKNEVQTKSALSTSTDHAENKPNPHQQDRFQQHAEQAFTQPSTALEAPSRKFLKHFNPRLSESASGLVKKGHFHYESIGREQRLKSSTAAPGNYADVYVKPAAQLQYHKQPKQQEQLQSPPVDEQKLHTHIVGSQPVTTSSDYKGYEATPIYESSTPTNEPGNVVFVTVNTPRPQLTPKPTPLVLLPPNIRSKSPHEYVAEAIGAASQIAPQKTEESKPNAGYTYVEVQKSVNIHNKLITEKDGQLVEQHETIYHQPQYAQNVAVSQQEASVSPKDYVSLSDHPINVQQIDDAGGETHEEAASQTASHHLQPPTQQLQEHYVEKIVPQPYPVAVEKVVDRPVEVEKIVDRPVKVPYPVHHYIDRPYPVREIIEQPVAVPFAVPEPVVVPVPIETYIDRPYPVETIVEKRVPYPVEKVVEKVVEKHVPVEVERIVDKPTVVEKVVEKLVDRPIAIPIHVPVAVHVPPYQPHPNELSWSHGPPPPQRYHKIPPKVLQNYYTRMLKKLLNPQIPNLQDPDHSSLPTIVPVSHVSSIKVTKPTQPTAPIQFTKPPFKISDIRFDLKPPPPPLGPSWSKGSRYIYNTLPAHLASALVPDQDFGPQQQILFVGAAPPAQSSDDASYDEFQRWRNGHALKRSPDFGRNLHIEYGFKPPLVPSMEIDEKGMPLKSSAAKDE